MVKIAFRFVIVIILVFASSCTVDPIEEENAQSIPDPTSEIVDDEDIDPVKLKNPTK